MPRVWYEEKGQSLLLYFKLFQLSSYKIGCQYKLPPNQVWLYGWPLVYFVWIQLLCLCWMSNSVICLFKTNPVKQEVSCTVILPPTYGECLLVTMMKVPMGEGVMYLSTYLNVFFKKWAIAGVFFFIFISSANS